MPEYKHFIYDVLNEINPKWITARCIDRNFIALIKAFRIVSGQGLKEAKDAIESCVVGDLRSGAYQVDQMQKLFATFIGPFNTEQEKALKEQKKKAIEEDKYIKAGVSCMLKHWRTLGFTTKFIALDNVIRNMEMKYQK